MGPCHVPETASHKLTQAMAQISVYDPDTSASSSASDGKQDSEDKGSKKDSEDKGSKKDSEDKGSKKDSEDLHVKNCMVMDLWVAYHRSGRSRASKKGYNYCNKNMRLTAFALRCQCINQANERIEMSHEDQRRQ